MARTLHRFSRLFCVGLAVVAIALPAARSEARPCQRDGSWPGVVSNDLAFAAGFSLRTGDWVAVDGLGVLLLPAARPWDKMFALVVRGEVGLGGSSAGIGLATRLLPSQGSRPGECQISEFLGAGVLSLEGRVERMYGPTSWRSTTYVGWQLSFAGIIFKPALGGMVASDNPRDQRVLLATGLGW
jgi:hypothetical protein